MKYCHLCHWLLRGRRWLLFPVTLTFTLFTPLFAPTWLFLLLLSLHLLVTAMCAIYLRDTMHFATSDYLRLPGPRDAYPEIVMVDAALLDHGPMMLCMAQPVNPVLEMHPSMGEGVVRLASAICLLNTTLPRPDAHALLNACKTQMDLAPTDLLTKYPVLRHATESGMKCITVQEDEEERTYFVGDAETVIKACRSIWEQSEHLMAVDDQSRLRKAAREMSSAGEHLYAFATALGDDDLTFLGFVAVGDSVDPVAVDELHQLRKSGVTLVLRDDNTRYMDVPVLRRNLGIPDLHTRPDVHLCIAHPFPDRHTLTIIRHVNRSFTRPLRDLRELFSNLNFMLGRLCSILGFCLLCCVLVGGMHSALAVTAILVTGYLSFGSLYSARAIRPVEMLLGGAGCLLVRLLLEAAAPGAQDVAGTFLCLTLATLLAFTLRMPERRLTPVSLVPLLAMVTALALLQLLSAGAILSSALLPVLFCIVCGGLIGSLFLFTGR